MLNLGEITEMNKYAKEVVIEEGEKDEEIYYLLALIGIDNLRFLREIDISRQRSSEFCNE